MDSAEPLLDRGWKQSQVLLGTPSLACPCSPRARCANGSSGIERFAVHSLQNIKPIPYLSLFPQQAAALPSPHVLNVNSAKDSCSLTGNRILPPPSQSIWVKIGWLLFYYFFSLPIIYTKIFVGCLVAKKSLFFQKRARERKKPIRSFS